MEHIPDYKFRAMLFALCIGNCLLSSFIEVRKLNETPDEAKIFFFKIYVNSYMNILNLFHFNTSDSFCLITPHILQIHRDS